MSKANYIATTHHEYDLFSESSYIIYKSGSTYYAVNGSDGTIFNSNTDAATLIDSAIDNLPADGGLIFIKAGTYAIDQMTVDRGNVTIVGEGYNTIIEASSYGYQFNFTGADGTPIKNIHIHNIHFKGANLDESGSLKQVGVHLQWVEDCSVQNCYVELFGNTDAEQTATVSEGCGILLRDVGVNTKILHNTVKNCKVAGISVVSTGGDSEARTQWGALIDGNDVEACYVGIHAIYKVYVFRIVNNYVYECRSKGIMLENSSGSPPAEDTCPKWGIVGFNTAESINGDGGSGGHGIYTLSAKYVLIIGNAIHDITGPVTPEAGRGTGIKIQSATDRVSRGIMCVDNIIDTVEGSGFYVTADCSEITWRGGWIRNAGFYGIDVDSPSDNLQLLDVRGAGNSSGMANLPSLTNLLIRNVEGFVTENTVLSSTFAIDSTGVKTVTVAHGLAVTPNVEDCVPTVIENTAVDDWAADWMKVTAVDGTNTTVKIKIGTASATGSATAKIGLRVRDYDG